MIKITGMLRKIDELGRVVLPIEIRNQFGYVEKDPIEIFMKNDKIILKKPILNSKEESVGIIRKLDELGRITIPKEIRNRLDLREKDEVEILIDKDSIILMKYTTNCIFCNRTKKLKKFNSKLICNICLKKIKSE